MSERRLLRIMSRSALGVGYAMPFRSGPTIGRILCGCDLVTIPAGHHVHEARPAEFAEAVLGWLHA
jgi:pimeloyl-ACP methyl ester carboxylesterase